MMSSKIEYIEKTLDVKFKCKPICFYVMMSEKFNNVYFVQPVFDVDRDWLLNEFAELCKKINIEYKTEWEVRVKKIVKYDADMEREYPLIGVLLSSRLAFYVAQFFADFGFPVLYQLMFFEKENGQYEDN